MKKLGKWTSLSLLLSLVSFAAFANVVGDNVVRSHHRSGLVVNERAELSGEITSQLYHVETIYRRKSVAVTDLVCREEGGNGKGNWYGFFNVPKSEKANSLAKAIKGVGQATAPQLVPYFNSKPRSWGQFKSVISNADRSIGNGLYYRVVVQYGQDNMRNLGYYSETNCHYETHYETIIVPEEVKTPFRQSRRSYSISIQDGDLLSTEKERFDVQFDGFDAQLVINSQYNRYSINKSERGSHVHFEVVGARQQVRPENSLNVMPYFDGDEYVLKIIDGLNNSETRNLLGTTVVEIVVHRDKKWNPIDEKFKLERELSASGETIVRTGVTKNGRKIFAKYSLKRVGSRFFNQKDSQTNKTSKLR